MRSMKLLVATAIVAALVAGPVLAQDAMTGTAAPASTTDAAKPAKHTHKHSGKKHSGKKHSAAPAAAPAATPAQ